MGVGDRGDREGREGVGQNLKRGLVGNIGGGESSQMIHVIDRDRTCFVFVLNVINQI